MARGSQGGKSNNPKGKPKGALSSRRSEWEAMGEALTGTWTDYITEYGNELIKAGNFEEFYPLYKDMVNYFKPKLSSAQVKQEVEHKVELSHDEIVKRINSILTNISDSSTE